MSAIRVRTGAASLQGKRRRNEDAVFAAGDASVALLGVFDGLGGHANGAEASAAARAKFPQATTDRGNLDWRAVYEALNDEVTATGGATTATTLLLGDGGPAQLAWCGDSPALRIRGSVVWAAKPHGVGNWVSRCLGGDYRTPWEPETHTTDVKPGDVWVLASDGLNPLLEEDGLKKFVRRLRASLKRGDQLGPLAERIAQAAIEAGSADNVTVAIAVVEAA
jgi:serine/threonine protein phosphatase PrpC